MQTSKIGILIDGGLVGYDDGEWLGSWQWLYSDGVLLAAGAELNPQRILKVCRMCGITKFGTILDYGHALWAPIVDGNEGSFRSNKHGHVVFQGYDLMTDDLWRFLVKEARFDE